ncbi:MAG: hypothetical protein ACI4D6_05495 [Chordicoccus sp.]
MTDEIKIRSRIFSYNEEESPESDVEQHLTIRGDGTVLLETYQFNYRICNLAPHRKETANVGSSAAGELIEKLRGAADGQEKTRPECGIWDIILTKDGRRTEGSGFMMDEDGNRELSEFVRDRLPLEELYLFDDKYDVDDGIDSWRDYTDCEF